MGLLRLIQGDCVYLDTNIWIYALEDIPKLGQALVPVFNAVDNGTLSAITSELTLAETLVKPLQIGNQAQRDTYTAALTSRGNLQVAPITRNILTHAAEIRATTRLKLPDAIHVATALRHNCTTFLSNDKQFRAVPGLTIVPVSDALTGNSENPET
ncbi:MAG: PIN domain-containing protein [Cyanobacteria bacterium J06648_11]